MNLNTNISTNINKDDININEILLPLLCKISQPNVSNEICLISKEIITNKITLPCKHSYDYEYLFEEIKQQKIRHKNYFKCLKR